jgi:hypothetical protein
MLEDFGVILRKTQGIAFLYRGAEINMRRMNRLLVLSITRIFSVFMCASLCLGAQSFPLKSLPSALNEAASSVPIGDNLHVAVYDFIVVALLKAKKVSQKEVKRIAQEEASILASSEPLKSHEAAIMESSFSHILNALCAYKKTCKSICLYQKDGLAIGITSENWDEISKVRPRKSYATLSVPPVSQLGLKEILRGEDKTYYEAILAVYLDQHNIASLSFGPVGAAKGKRPIGYVRYIFTFDIL